jgi:S-DNA-T family DNA segregation ATPase FtsK/SpoIIIE
MRKKKNKSNPSELDGFPSSESSIRLITKEKFFLLFSLLLIFFSVFSFSSLFGKAGNLGDNYFTYITSTLGVFAYLTPLIYISWAFVLLTKRGHIFTRLNFWLFAVLFIAAFIFLGFLNMSGSLGNNMSLYLRSNFGTIPTIFLLLVSSMLALFRIFETDLFALFNKTTTNHHTDNQLESALNLPENTQTSLQVQTTESKPGFFSKFFFWKNSKPDKKISVNHSEGLDQYNEDEYEEVEVEENQSEEEDYRSAMYKAVSVDLTKEEKEKIMVKKLVKKEIPQTSLENKKMNEETLKRVNEKYNHPPVSMYAEDTGKASAGDNKENARIIKRTLADFGISVEMDEVTVGPTVTRYALKPAQGVKIEKIMNLANNIALELGVASVSITRVHERSLIGIEVPNKQKASLGIGSLLGGREFAERKDKLTMTLGRDIYGNPVFVDMTKMPHLLIAGTTGSGKSSLIHALINSLIYKNSPYGLKFILIDPKKVEFALYANLPHLYTPVIKDPKKAVQTLNWLVQEMDRRYQILEECGKQNISAYYSYAQDKYKKAEEKGGSKEKLPEKMPYIVLVIDELADFMMKYPKEMESGIVKLAQMSRAVGIHLILATQRPSTNVITGVIKGNIPSRIALRVASQVDSRVIIDQGGAEKLLGYGDLLFVNADGSDLKRIQSPFVKEEEIKDVVAYLREEYDDVLTEELKSPENVVVGAQNLSGSSNSFSDSDFESDDDKYEQAKEVVLQTGKTSVSNLQVRLGTGYARSAKLINMLEQAGVITTVTDNSGKKVKVVAGHGKNSAEAGETLEQTTSRQDILSIEANQQTNDSEELEAEREPQPEKSVSFFKF